jgi:hypothetical protein
MTFVEGNINSQKYISILSDCLLPFYDDFPLSFVRDSKFQQDNARPHTALATRNFFQTHTIAVPYWPSLSPDINPIENVWGIMKRKVRLMKPTSMEALRFAITVAWNDTVTPHLCRKLYASMPTRLVNIIRRRGLR